MSKECVRVCVRCRPLSQTEISDERMIVVKIDNKKGEVNLINPKAAKGTPPKTYTFDKVFD